MPYDINIMFGVLADPDLMGKLKCRGRSKQFEKDMAENMAQEDEHHNLIAEAEDIAKDIDAELQRLVLLKIDDKVELAEGCVTEAEQAVNHTTNISTSIATPAPSRTHQYLDTTPRSPLSGKPSHRHRRDQAGDGSTDATTPILQSPCPAPAEQPRELFIFTNKRSYSHARALFATASQPDHPANLRWSQLASLLTSPPISCHVVPARNGGASVTVVRPARIRVIDGEELALEKRSVVLHRPHGGANAWVERHVLENMAGSWMARFGWERGDFVLEGA